MVRFLEQQNAEELFVSSVTFAEIRFRIEMAPDPLRRSDLRDWLENRLRPEFENRILPVSEDVMLRWRMMVDEGKKIGRTFSQPDLIIAATAVQHDLTLVTRNIVDFAGLRIPIMNPWKV